MRVLFLTSHLEVGGIPVYTVSLARALARRGHETLVASSGGSLVARLTDAGIPHVPLPLRVKSEFHPAVALAVVRLAALIRRQRPDLIHAQTRVAHVVAGLVGRMTGVPVVTTAHGFYRWRWGRRLFPFWGDRAIAVGPATFRKLVLGYRVPQAKIALILNGIDWQPMDPARLQQEAAWFRQAWGVTNGAPVIGTVARLSLAKGIDILLRAFHQLRQRWPSARLLIVGEGPKGPELVRLAYALGDQDHVIFSGMAASTQVPLAVMDVFVLSSRREAFGLALVEAMAMRRPVVATRVGGIRAVVQHGVTGLLVRPKDSEALSEALQQLLEQPQLARAMGEAGYRRYQEQFTIDRVAAEVEEVYRQVLNNVTSDK